MKHKDLWLGVVFKPSEIVLPDNVYAELLDWREPFKNLSKTHVISFKMLVDTPRGTIHPCLFASKEGSAIALVSKPISYGFLAASDVMNLGYTIDASSTMELPGVTDADIKQYCDHVIRSSVHAVAISWQEFCELTGRD